ncbi:mandelate racemase/muconate lactonizing enzyme family protein [Paroceanicella profunda]|uniref:Mandelate racemase/muconate lactonizing enzyme family protein n=1 Tax=Paroceanicella profunda TaxID=2579971 RepID=A0A5B8FH29_9RHOB|nr:mandelate racemase/muconate lactonizing enzyme family protein [Paroceanicella profunda]QDL91538.1 mandelate racemase/muconate lactonizing enzyme family protein [Paroceanicella profunda]
MSRIAEVSVHLLDAALDAPFQSATGQFDRRQHCLVEITCEDGTTGWGECLGPARPNAAMVRAMRPLLIGQEAGRIEPLWLGLYNAFRDQGQTGLTVTALSGIDIALWDIAGKRFGVPCHALLGGAFRTEVPAYATGGFRRLKPGRPAYLAEETAGYVAEGFGAVKIKIGYDVAEDIEAIHAVRAAIGPDIGFMIDANHGYDAIEALKLARAVAECDIGWFEEPVVPEDFDGYKALRAGQPIPVAGGETWHTRWGFARAIAARVVDILQPDVCGMGGLSEAKKVSDMASAASIRVIPHCWGTGVAVAAGLQYLAILPDYPSRHEPRQPMLEFDQTPNPFRMAVLKTPITHTGGIVKVPDGPGLGIEIDRDALARFAMEA